MRERRGKAGKRDSHADDLGGLEDTQPLIPGYPTRRDVVRFAKELLDNKSAPPRSAGDGTGSGTPEAS